MRKLCTYIHKKTEGREGGRKKKEKKEGENIQSLELSQRENMMFNPDSTLLNSL